MAVLTVTACGPPAVVPGKFGGNWWETVVKAVNQVFGSPPDNIHVDCSVVLFDQSIRDTDFKADWTPVHTPNDIYAWLGGCFGAQYDHHIAPTFRASGLPNTPNPNKQAVCWVDTFVPDGDLIFSCHFDRVLPEQAWVPYLSTNRSGYLAVGS